MLLDGSKKPFFLFLHKGNTKISNAHAYSESACNFRLFKWWMAHLFCISPSLIFLSLLLVDISDLWFFWVSQQRNNSGCHGKSKGLIFPISFIGFFNPFSLWRYFYAPSSQVFPHFLIRALIHFLWAFVLSGCTVIGTNGFMS